RCLPAPAHCALQLTGAARIEDCRQTETVQQISDKGVRRKTQHGGVDEHAHNCAIFLSATLISPRIAAMRLSARICWLLAKQGSLFDGLSKNGGWRCRLLCPADASWPGCRSPSDCLSRLLAPTISSTRS